MAIFVKNLKKNSEKLVGQLASQIPLRKLFCWENKGIYPASLIAQISNLQTEFHK